MEREYWARRGKIQIGPFATRDAALYAYREQHPHKGPEYMASANKNQIMTGYGTNGPFFDIRWHDAKERV